MSQERGPRTRRGWVTGVLLVAGLVLVLAGGAAWWAQRPTSASTPAPTTGGQPTPSEATTPAPQEVVEPVTLPRAQRVRTEPGAPQQLQVPALSIDAPVIPIGAPGGVLTPPADPQTLGWWADGARPGASQGSALVTGHTVHTGGGAMDDLEQLEPGDRVWMTTGRGRIGYSVQQVNVLGKGELAERAQTIFDQEVPGRLVLITCEDWDGVDYLSNVVVTATPIA